MMYLFLLGCSGRNGSVFRKKKQKIFLHYLELTANVYVDFICDNLT